MRTAPRPSSTRARNDGIVRGGLGQQRSQRCLGARVFARAEVDHREPVAELGLGVRKIRIADEDRARGIEIVAEQRGLRALQPLLHGVGVGRLGRVRAAKPAEQPVGCFARAGERVALGGRHG